MTKPIACLACAAAVDGKPTVVDARFPAAYAASSAALLGLYSAEVMRGKRWATWGLPAAHFPAFRAFVGVYSVWREASLVDGAFERGVKEVICACVSASVRFVCGGGFHCVEGGGLGGVRVVRGGWWFVWGGGGGVGVWGGGGGGGGGGGRVVCAPGLAVGRGWVLFAEWRC